MFKTLALLTSLTAAATAAFAEDNAGSLFGFFGGRDIDYWAEGREVSGQTPANSAPSVPKQQDGTASQYSGSSVVRAGDAKPFAWNTYRDPRSPEFWDDGGDWIPPRPFREAAAEPTAKNVSEYLAWQARKTEVVRKFQAALTAKGTVPEHLGTRPKDPALATPGSLPPHPSVSAGMAVPWREIKLAYFYQTSCPHCRASKAAVEEAERLGVQVLFVQLDHASSPPLHTPSVPYSAEWDQAFHVSSTPTWVFSRQGKTVKHTGAMSVAELQHVASTLIN